MESYKCMNGGAKLVDFCKSRFNGKDIALMYEQGRSDGRVFVRAESAEVISSIMSDFELVPGAPGFDEFVAGRWMKIGRTEWFENSITLHFSNAS